MNPQDTSNQRLHPVFFFIGSLVALGGIAIAWFYDCIGGTVTTGEGIVIILIALLYPSPKRLWWRVRQKTIYRPKNSTLIWFLGRSVLTIIVIFFLIHLAMATFFSWLYSEHGDIRMKDGQVLVQASGVFSLLPFSMLTQTTLNFGQHLPVGQSQLIVAFHATLGLMLNALMMGLVVSKIVKPNPSFVLSSKLAYDPVKEHCFYFRLWNKSADIFSNLQLSAKIVRTVQLESFPYRTAKAFPLAIHINEPGILVPNIVLTLSTMSLDIDPKKPADLKECQENHIAITTLKPFDTIIVTVNAISLNRGDHVAEAKSYGLSHIVCGKLLSIRPHYRNERDKGPIEFKNLERCEPCVSCEACDLVEMCPVYVVRKKQ